MYCRKCDFGILCNFWLIRPRSQCAYLIINNNFICYLPVDTFQVDYIGTSLVTKSHTTLTPTHPYHLLPWYVLLQAPVPSYEIYPSHNPRGLLSSVSCLGEGVVGGGSGAVAMPYGMILEVYHLEYRLLSQIKLIN